MRRFPKERLRDLTLEQYALGHEGTRESFCYWLERETRYLGSILGGSAAKFGVYYGSDGEWHWNARYESAEEAASSILNGIATLVAAAEEGRFDDLDRLGRDHLGRLRYSLRCKPLNLYFPDEFLPIYTLHGLKHFLRLFGAESQGKSFRSTANSFTCSGASPSSTALIRTR